MNSDIVEGKWKQMKGSVQAKWGKLTDDDFDQIKGNRERLVGILQERYGHQKDKARKEVDDYFKTL